MTEQFRTKAAQSDGLDGALRAAILGDARAKIDQIVKDYDFRIYNPRKPWASDAAREAIFAWTIGTIRDAEQKVSTLAPVLDELADFRDYVARIPELEEIADIGVRKVAALTGQRPSPDLRSRAFEAALSVATKRANELDPSRPFDALEGTDVVICYIPGFGSSARLEDTRTSHWSEESNALTIKPDVNFLTFLQLARVSPALWVNAVKEVHGVDVTRLPENPGGAWECERAHMWAQLPQGDQQAQPILPVEALVEAVDNCYTGFTPLIAFAMDAKDILTRNWEKKLSVTGGVIGLHDFVDGTGSPLRFETTVELCAEPADIAIGEGVGNDFAEVHGFRPETFESRVVESIADMNSPDTAFQH